MTDRKSPDALATASQLVDDFLAKAATDGHNFRLMMEHRGALVTAIARAIEGKDRDA